MMHASRGEQSRERPGIQGILDRCKQQRGLRERMAENQRWHLRELTDASTRRVHSPGRERAKQDRRHELRTLLKTIARANLR